VGARFELLTAVFRMVQVLWCDPLSTGNWLPTRTFGRSVFLKVKDSRKVCGFSWTVWPWTWRHFAFLYQSTWRNIP